MSETVWVIEEGAYSDYHVVGVFSSREKAEEVFEWLGLDPKDYDEPRVVEWKLDPGVSEIRKGLVPYDVCMAADGSVEKCQVEEPSTFGFSDRPWPWTRTSASAYRDDPGVQDAVMGTVMARDAEHAVKIVNEHRIAFLASGEITAS